MERTGADDLEKLQVIRAEICRLLGAAAEAEGLGRVLRLALNAPGRAFDEAAGFRWALLPLWVCESLGVPWQRAVPVGVAVELLAAAGEILDDVQDRDNPLSLASQVSEADAINASVSMVALAYRVVAVLASPPLRLGKLREAVQGLTSFVVETAIGQHHDLRLTVGADATEEQYFQVAAKKSGAPLSYACSLGALVASDRAEVIQGFVEYGRYLGVAFQISNDLQYFTPSGGHKSDIRDRKLTLPVVYGLATIGGSDGDLLRQVYGGTGTVSPEEEADVRGILIRHGAVFYGKVQENLWRARALQRLAATPGTGEGLKRLEFLAAPPE